MGQILAVKYLTCMEIKIKTNTTKSVPLIFCKHSEALLWYVGL